MRILHIIPTLGAGGAEKLLLDLIEGMKKKDINIEVLVLSSKKHFYSETIEKLNIPIYYGKSEKSHSLSHIKEIYSTMKNNYDVIHTHLYPAQLFLSIASFFRKKKAIYITTEHSTYNKRRGKKIFKLLDKVMYAQYDKIIAISEGVKQELVNSINIKPKKIKVINNGIDLNKYKDALKIKKTKLVSDYKEGDFLILMVAGFRKMKDYKTVIRAAARLPNNYKFIFVGDGPERQKIEEYSKENKVSNVYFLGVRKDVPNIMKSVDIFVLSSHWEGFGLVIVEAMASGLPVIGTNVEGLRDVINESGFLFEVEDDRKLSLLIKKTKENKQLRIKYTKKGLKRSGEYSIDKTINEYILVYKNS